MVAFAFLIVAGQCPLEAATYHVSKTGNDLNPGTLEQPWLTIQKAANTMIAGDIVNIAPGEYREIVTSKNHGVSNNPIVFQGAVDLVSVDGFVVKHAYQIIRDFRITGASVAGYQGSVTVQTGGRNLSVYRCFFDGSPRGVYQFLTTASSSDVDGTTIEGCRFEHAGNHAVVIAGSNAAIRRNYFTNQDGYDAIDCFASDSVIANNVFENWSNTSGLNPSYHSDIIQSFATPGTTQRSQNVVFENNFAFNGAKCQPGSIRPILKHIVSDD